MSQSAVSQAIAALEHALQVPLLDRGPRGVEPTMYGTALMRRGQAAFDELRSGIKDIEFLTDPELGEVRVACTEATAAGILPPVIERFSRRYPKVRLNVIQTSTHLVGFAALHERSADLVLTQLSKAFEGDLTEPLQAEVLFLRPSLPGCGKAKLVGTPPQHLSRRSGRCGVDLAAPQHPRLGGGHRGVQRGWIADAAGHRNNGLGCLAQHLMRAGPLRCGVADFNSAVQSRPLFPERAAARPADAAMAGLARHAEKSNLEPGGRTLHRMRARHCKSDACANTCTQVGNDESPRTVARKVTAATASR
jgi:DNA-binding transcriptional LysR family regulator